MLKNIYIPINCDFHDLLLDRITLRKKVWIEYKTQQGRIRKQTMLIDVYTKNKEEFLVMENEETIRLDQIISLDDNSLGDASSCKF